MIEVLRSSPIDKDKFVARIKHDSKGNTWYLDEERRVTLLDDKGKAELQRQQQEERAGNTVVPADGFPLFGTKMTAFNKDMPAPPGEIAPPENESHSTTTKPADEVGSVGAKSTEASDIKTARRETGSALTNTFGRPEKISGTNIPYWTDKDGRILMVGADAEPYEVEPGDTVTIPNLKGERVTKEFKSKDEGWIDAAPKKAPRKDKSTFESTDNDDDEKARRKAKGKKESTHKTPGEEVPGVTLRAKDLPDEVIEKDGNFYVRRGNAISTAKPEEVAAYAKFKEEQEAYQKRLKEIAATKSTGDTVARPGMKGEDIEDLFPDREQVPGLSPENDASINQVLKKELGLDEGDDTENVIQIPVTIPLWYREHFVPVGKSKKVFKYVFPSGEVMRDDVKGDPEKHFTAKEVDSLIALQKARDQTKIEADLRAKVAAEKETEERLSPPEAPKVNLPELIDGAKVLTVAEIFADKKKEQLFLKVCNRLDEEAGSSTYAWVLTKLGEGKQALSEGESRMITRARHEFANRMKIGETLRDGIKKEHVEMAMRRNGALREDAEYNGPEKTFEIMKTQVLNIAMSRSATELLRYTNALSTLKRVEESQAYTAYTKEVEMLVKRANISPNTYSATGFTTPGGRKSGRSIIKKELIDKRYSSFRSALRARSFVRQAGRLDRGIQSAGFTKEGIESAQNSIAQFLALTLTDDPDLRLALQQAAARNKSMESMLPPEEKPTTLNEAREAGAQQAGGFKAFWENQVSGMSDFAALPREDKMQRLNESAASYANTERKPGILGRILQMIFTKLLGVEKEKIAKTL